MILIALSVWLPVLSTIVVPELTLKGHQAVKPASVPVGLSAMELVISASVSA